jgi:transcriptional regulator with GAF, ATPase, and Fis domain
VLRVHLPPLRERPGDVILLARHFVEGLSQTTGAGRKFLSPAALRRLEQYYWPGNVRELYNTVHRAVLTTPGSEIASSEIEIFHGADGTSAPAETFHFAKTVAIERFERDFVQRLLERHAGNVSRAAREAGKDRRAFGRLAKKYGLKHSRV